MIHMPCGDALSLLELDATDDALVDTKPSVKPENLSLYS